jgi:O-antigen/teichoic acid export membrane protein
MRKFLKDMALFAPSQFLPALTALITTPILTRLFPPAEYAFWSLALSVSSLLVALAGSGLGSAALRFYPAYATRSALDVFFAAVGVSVGVAITAVGGVSLLALALFRTALPAGLVRLWPLVVLIFVVQSVFGICMVVIRAQARSGLFTVLQLTTNYGGLGLGLLLVVAFGWRVEGLLWGTFLALVLSLPFLLALATRGVRIRLREFQLKDAVQLWEYAWPLTLGNVATWALRVSDLFIIAAVRPARDVGLYSVSYNISSKSIELLGALFLLSVSPLVYRTWETEGREATETTLTMVTRVYLIVCVPAVAGLIVLAHPFVALLTAPEYYEGSRIVGLVVVSSFTWGLASIAMLGLTIKKQALRLGGNEIVAASVHIGLMLLMVPRFGYIAAAVSTLISYGVLLGLHATASRPHLTWRFPVTTARNVLTASIVMGFATWGVYRLAGTLHGVSALFLLLSIAVAVPTYGVCLWQFGEFDAAELKTAWTMWTRLTAK